MPTDIRISATVNTVEIEANIVAQTGVILPSAQAAEHLTATDDPRVWLLTYAPKNQVAVFDDVPMRISVDYDISGQTVTFLLIDPVAPYAIYQH